MSADKEVVLKLVDAMTDGMAASGLDPSRAEIISAVLTMAARLTEHILACSDAANKEANRAILRSKILEVYGRTVNSDVIH